MTEHDMGLGQDDDRDSAQSLMRDPGQTAGDGQQGDAASDKQADVAKIRRKHKKLIIVAVVIVVAIAAAGIAMSVWHESPSFCNALCHTPMNEYVENYTEGDGMARVHKEAGITCLGCHEPSLGEQASEAWKWITGDFRYPLDMIDYDDTRCLTCHVSEAYQAAKTDLLELNPHADAHQALQCTDCHRSHDDQVDYCAKCHDNGGQRMISWPLEGHAVE